MRRFTIIGGLFGLVGPIYYLFNSFHLAYDPFWLFPFAILTLDTDLAYSMPIVWLIYIAAVLLNVCFYTGIGFLIGLVVKGVKKLIR